MQLCSSHLVTAWEVSGIHSAESSPEVAYIRPFIDSNVRTRLDKMSMVPPIPAHGGDGREARDSHMGKSITTLYACVDTGGR
ncbi:hypothetical protein J2S98_002470 [Arthrobacter oryzae]|nr:hypothetical protein [Arthrobacter oryzae]